MNLKHLMQAYKFNNIEAELKEMNDKNEKAGVIKFTEDINASYLLDNEGIVIAICIFANCMARKNKKIELQFSHTIQIINILQKTIEIIGNTKKEEANKIFEQLNMFNGKIEAKAVKFINHIYKIDIVDGVLMFSIIESNIDDE